MSRKTYLVACFIRMLSLTHCVCPDKMWSPPKCDRICACDWTHTVSCRLSTGECVCRTGFASNHCTDRANCINSDNVCSEREYCQNVNGVSTCKCLKGFRRSSITKRCEPCEAFAYGETCSKKCNCVVKNSVMCEKIKGTCVCTLGWEGPACDVSVDDCVGSPCPKGICQDKHNGYECKCKDGYRMIHKQCLEYRTDFIASNYNPDVGEIIDVYILFHLPVLYHTNVLMGDDFMSVLEGDDSTGKCIVTLHKHKQEVYGDESFFNLLDNTQPRPVEYHYYSSYKVMFEKPGQRTLKIHAYPETNHPMYLTFTVQYKSTAVRDCFKYSYISGTTDFPSDPRIHSKLKRQKSHEFSLKFNDTGRCKEKPEFRWHYSSVDEAYFKGNLNTYCGFGKYFKPLDIIRLVRQSGRPEMSDHMSEKEVLPPNTLPLGPILICVSAYIQNDTKSSASACGLVHVIPSNTILGSIVPRRYIATQDLHNIFPLDSNFWDPDRPMATLRYRWSCKCDSNDLDWGNNPKAYSPRSSEMIYSNRLITLEVWSDDHGAKVSDSLKIRYDSGKADLLRNIGNFQKVVNYKTSPPTRHIDIKCHQTCLGDEFPVWKELALEVDRPHDPWLGVIWSMSEDQKGNISKRQLQIMSYHWLDSPKFKIKRNALAPNTAYTVRVAFQDSPDYRYSYAEKKFKTLANPSVNCRLNPRRGDLVTQRFNFECAKNTPRATRLMYRLTQQDWIGGRKETNVLIGYSGTETIPDLTLSRFVRGNVNGGEVVSVELTWEAFTLEGANISSKKTHSMNLNPVLDVSDVLDPTLGKHRQSNTQENLRRHKDIATMMNLEWTRNITQENFAMIRQQLLRNMNNKEPLSLSTVRLKSFVMATILEREEEILEDGLDDGIDTVTHLVDYIDSFTDQDIFTHVFWSHIHCLDRLLIVVHELTLYYKSNPGELSIKGLQKNKERSLRLTYALTHLGKSLIAIYDDPDKKKEETDTLNLQVRTMPGNKLVGLGTNADFIGFRMPYIGRTSPYALLQLFKKNPYAWVSDEVFGNFTVLDLKFFTKNGHNTRAIENWRFKEPLTLYLGMSAPKPEIKEIPLKIVVNKMNKKILMSSCVTMTINAFTTENTVLRVTSSDGFKLKVQTILAATSESFEGRTDDDILDFPFRRIKNFGDRDLDILVLPRISSRQVLSENEKYHVRFTIKKNQTSNATLLANPDEAIVKLLLQENLTEIHTTTIVVSAYSMSCKNFDKSYKSNICRLSIQARLDKMRCHCWVAGTYTGSVRAQNSLLDTKPEVVLEVFDNPLVNVMVGTLWAVFVASVFWAVKKDKLDGRKSKATILEDNEEGDTHVYLVCITTGTSMTSAPSADVLMYFRGTNSSTRPHVFWDRDKVTFQPGSDEWFVMTTSEDIGDVTSSVVWTVDRGGEKDQSWHLISVYIENMLTKEAWLCRYNGWLSSSSGLEDIVEIPARNEKELLNNKRVQLMTKWSHDLRNRHLWFGLVGKSPYNKFTRARRLATALTVMQCILLLNLVCFDYYKIVIHYRLDPYRTIHMACIFIGLLSSVLSTLVGLVIAFLFSRYTDGKSSVGDGSKVQHNVSQNAAAEGGEAPATEDVEKKETTEGSKQEEEVSPVKEEQKPEKAQEDVPSAPSKKPGGLFQRFFGTEPEAEKVAETGKKEEGDVNKEEKTAETTGEDTPKPQGARMSAGLNMVWGLFSKGQETEPQTVAGSGKKEEDVKKNEEKLASPLKGEKDIPKGPEKEVIAAKKEEDNQRKTTSPLLENSPEKTKNNNKPDETKPKNLFRDLSAVAGGVTERIMQGENAPEAESTPVQKEEIEQVTSKKSEIVPEVRTDRPIITENIFNQLKKESLMTIRRVMQAKLTAKSIKLAQKPRQLPPKKEPFRLPRWFVIIVWPVVLALNVFLSYHIVLYGFSVSYRRSLDWLVAFLVGLLANVLVYQPLVIIFSGCFLVLVCGRTYPHSKRGPHQRLDETRKRVKSLWKAGVFKKNEGKKQTIKGKVQIRCSQFIAKDIMRRLRIEGDARQILRDLVGYSMFLVSAVYLINKYMKITPRFWITENLKTHFLKNLNLSQSMNVTTMWDHFSNTILPVLKPTADDSKPIHMENTYLFGTARLRQVRIMGSTGRCEDIIGRLAHYYSGHLCARSVYDGTEETRLFDESWDKPVHISNETHFDSPYTYHSAEELEHRYHHIGAHGYYSAGGYIQLITPDDPYSVGAALLNLKTSGWIDQLTKCLFVEFTLYHPNLNIISGVRIAFEFVNYGAIYTSASFETSSLMFVSSWPIVIAEVILSVGLLYYTYAAYKAIRVNGLKYFHNIWHLMEISLLVLSFTAVTLVFLLVHAQFEVTKKYKEHGDTRYTDFSEVFDLEVSMQCILGCLGALIILKTFKLITFNPFMAKFSTTLEISSPNLAGYLVLTIIFAVAFSCTGSVLFGTMMIEYSTIRYSMFAHIRFVLGVPDLREMFAADWVMGRIFAVLGLGITKYIIINVFISILRESFGLANQMTYRDEETTVFYVKDIALRFFGITQKPR